MCRVSNWHNDNLLKPVLWINKLGGVGHRVWRDDPDGQLAAIRLYTSEADKRATYPPHSPLGSVHPLTSDPSRCPHLSSCWCTDLMLAARLPPSSVGTLSAHTSAPLRPTRNALVFPSNLIELVLPALPVPVLCSGVIKPLGDVKVTRTHKTE